MVRVRIIPCLQLIRESLVKTVKFTKPNYIGDPVNTVRIFNELEVDELCFLDIRATKENYLPNYKILREIADECFMPLSYGGGIKDAETAQKVLSIGFEKVVLNTAAFKRQQLISDIAKVSGSQSVIISIDIKRNIFGNYKVFICDGTKKTDINPLEWARTVEDLGAGELMITSIDRDGTWSGYDLDIIHKISDSVKIPVIANGGAGNINHIAEAFHTTNVSAVALGSMVVYQAKGFGVLVNFPDKKKLDSLLI